MIRFPIFSVAVFLLSGPSFAQALLQPTTHDPVTQGPPVVVAAPAPGVAAPVQAPPALAALPSYTPEAARAPDAPRVASTPVSIPDAIMIPEAADPSNAFGVYAPPARVYAPPARVYAPPARAAATPEPARKGKQRPVATDTAIIDDRVRNPQARPDARPRRQVAQVSLSYVAPRRVSHGCGSLACSQFVLMGVAY